MYPWYIWNNHIAYLSTALGGCVSIVMLTMCNAKKEFNENLGLVIALALLAGYMCFKSNINGILSWICQLFIWLSLIGLDINNKRRILKFITKWFSIFLIISATFYILWLFNIFSLLPTRIQYDDGRYLSDNYYLFTNGLIDFRISDFYRFKSIFMEPGHMTMGIVPLIILNRFNLKNIYVSFLFFAEILSFSLAGIISMTVGYVLLNLNKKMLRNIWLGSFVVVALILGLSKAGYDEVLDVYLWSRIEITEDGQIAGYNRTSDNLNKLFNRVMMSPYCLFGLPEFDGDTGDGGNAGYKVYFLQNGFLGLILILGIYLYYLHKYHDYNVFIVTLIFLMLLFQNSYPTWICVLGTYILGLPTFYADQESMNTEHKNIPKQTHKNESIVCRT